jgi:hypothetical protein
MLGVGAQHTKDPDGIAWKQNQDFENLLKRLNANPDDLKEDRVSSAPIDGFQPARSQGATPHLTKIESEAAGGDYGEKWGKKRKKRPQDSDETTNAERKSKKRKRTEPTTIKPVGAPAEKVPLRSKSPTPENTLFVMIYDFCENAMLTPVFQRLKQAQPPWAWSPGPVYRLQEARGHLIKGRRGNPWYTFLSRHAPI